MSDRGKTCICTTFLFGPRVPIDDDPIDLFTSAIDRLAYETPGNPLFCVAVGNDGVEAAPYNRIQPPSDCVNGLGVGAYTFDRENVPVRAAYSCLGPGREGAKTKPDLLDFGGSVERPFVTASPASNSLALFSGTSFASPLVAHKAGILMASCEAIEAQMAKALLLHHAGRMKEGSVSEYGWGICCENPGEILECGDNRVDTLFQGEMYPGKTYKLPVFAPKINEMPGKAVVKWTIVTVAAPDENDSDAYTSTCLEDRFYPHAETFNFTKGSKTKKFNLNDPHKLEQAREYERNGYVQSKGPVPVTGNPLRSKNEDELRSEDLKWDTAVTKSRSMQCSSLYEPFITIHAMERAVKTGRPVKYFVVVTVEVEQYRGSLYDAVINRYQSLEPINIRETARART